MTMTTTSNRPARSRTARTRAARTGVAVGAAATALLLLPGPADAAAVCSAVEGS